MPCPVGQAFWISAVAFKVLWTLELSPRGIKRNIVHAEEGWGGARGGAETRRRGWGGARGDAETRRRGEREVIGRRGKS